jgi:hypothetical protein
VETGYRIKKWLATDNTWLKRGAQDAKNILENPNADMADTQEVTPTDAGVDNPNETIGYVTGPENTGASLSAVNDNLKNMTGRQHQALLRIVNQYQKQRINEAQAILMLKSSFGFSDEEAKTMLGITAEQQVQMSSQYPENDWNSWELESNYEISQNE